MSKHIPRQTIILQCQACNAIHDPAQPLWACPNCGGLLDLHMPAAFPWEIMQSRPPGLWRYREALPLAPETAVVSLGETITPLLAVPAGPIDLRLKLDFFFPTGSFKDRGAALLLSKIKELGVREIVEDSSGNAGAAIAAYAAAAGVQANIFVPASASAAKTAQIQLYRARLHQIPGPRIKATKAAQIAAQRSYYASHVWNPYFFQGVKTVAFELWEQLDGQIPDWVITPVGHGTMLLGLAKGFEHLRQAGAIDRLPRLAGVQAASCAPLVSAYQTGSARLPDLVPGPTQAEGIAISQPLRWRQILQAIAASHGDLLAVPEAAIAAAHRHWAGRGLLMEPTAATGPAAFQTLLERQIIKPGQVVIIIITGSGLKSAAKMQKTTT